ncbi:alpha-glucan family phosphorylase [Candidatus Woesearchaeota archaeon]|nr:alpha-glucan family phosphorylase [Candidatus Woesearchaeota archaeon]
MGKVSEPKLGDKREHIAYFTMEVGISHHIPTYSGGLGILAGDLLKSYADLRIPIVGVTLLSEKGYFYQKVDSEGNQVEQPVRWTPSDFMTLLPNIVSLDIEGRTVKIRAWKLVVKGGLGGQDIPIFFLDTNVDGNSDYDRTLTSFLYGGDRAYRLAQEMVLGIGGVRMLEELGYFINKYHMNEGHASLLIVELVKKTSLLLKDTKVGSESWNEVVGIVKDKCVFTTHTPVAAGHDRFDVQLFRKITNNQVPEALLQGAIHEELVNMTLFALNHSKYVNGVAKMHGEVTKEMFPGYTINAITNGIHSGTWASPPFKRIFDKYIPGWSADPFSLRYAMTIPKEDLWSAHLEAKKILMDEINQRTNLGFQISRFTIGYARRFTAYKRPDLILFDLERIKKVAEKVGDIQIVFAGKAHSQDTTGKGIIKKVYQIAKSINSQNCKVKIVFLDHYDMRLANILVAGCDVWLNTPQRPYEASGTSGMKAALNGVPQLSTLDGWWLEGHIENLTGWSLGPHPSDPGFKEDYDPGDEANDLYVKLEKVIVPAFYGNQEKWVDIMKHCIALNGSFFNTHRMAEQYIANAYLD